MAPFVKVEFVHQSKTYKYCVKRSWNDPYVSHCEAVKACRDQDSYLALLENFPNKGFFSNETELVGGKQFIKSYLNKPFHFIFLDNYKSTKHVDLYGFGSEVRRGNASGTLVSPSQDIWIENQPQDFGPNKRCVQYKVFSIGGFGNYGFELKGCGSKRGYLCERKIKNWNNYH